MTSLRVAPKVSGATLLARPLLAAILAVTLVGGTTPSAYAQGTPQNPPPAPAPQAKPSGPAEPFSLGTAKYHYARSPRPFPNIFAPYTAIKVAPSSLANSPRIEQLIHEGKLEISLQDAVELALENSVDGSSASLNPFAFVIQSYDPLLTSSISYDDNKSPINNPFISGTGTATVGSVVSHSSSYNTQYSQYFPTGTSMTVTYDNTRSSNSIAANLFNPAVQSSIFLGLTQNLLSGFGLTVNRRNIIISHNNRKIADLAFAQQAITSVTNTITGEALQRQ